MRFVPCQDKCSYEGSHCQGCGRSHQEIAETKKLVAALVEFGLRQGYDNIDEFGAAIGKSLAKKLHKARARA